MASSDLRIQDIRDAYRLIGECRDLGSDAALWQPRLFDGLCQLVGAPAACGGEGVLDGPQGRMKPLSAFDARFDVHARQVREAFMREVGPEGCPILCALKELPGQVVTRTRQQLVRNEIWYRSIAFEYRRNHFDNQLSSFYWTAPRQALSVICVSRAPGERDFSQREQALLNFLHSEIGPLIGRSLASATEPAPEGLSPRLRQTLACLLEGDSEKQIAARLGLSQPTTHQYVTALYRHFGVRSRAQLLAHVIRRMGRSRWSTADPMGSPVPQVDRVRGDRLDDGTAYRAKTRAARTQ